MPTITDPADLHESFMRKALTLADYAASKGEVPVGAVVVLHGEIIGQGWNCPIGQQDPSSHAEIMAIRQAAEHMGNYRLPNTCLYVTIEPCSMCVGAMVHARIETLVYGASEPRAGAAGSAIELINHPAHNHRIQLLSGILAQECAEVMQAFFRRKREQ